MDNVHILRMVSCINQSCSLNEVLVDKEEISNPELLAVCHCIICFWTVC